MTPTEQLARPRSAVSALDIALRHADADALEARQIIIGMRSQHANMVVVLDAIQEAIKDADWSDFAEVIDSLNDAEMKLQQVYATPKALLGVQS